MFSAVCLPAGRQGAYDFQFSIFILLARQFFLRFFDFN